MKKSRLIVSILLTIVLVLSMTACVQDKPTPSPSPSTSTTTTTTTTGPVVTPTPTTSTPSKPAHNIDWQPGGSSTKSVDLDKVFELTGTGTYNVNDYSSNSGASINASSFAGTLIFGKIDIATGDLIVNTPNATVVFTDEVKVTKTTVTASLNTTKVEGNANFSGELIINKGNLVVTKGTLGKVTIPSTNDTITSISISGGTISSLAPAKAVTVTIENAPTVAIAPTAKIIIEQKSSSSKVTLDLTDGSAGALIKPSAGAAKVELPTAQAGKVEVELTGNTTVDDVLSKPSTEGDETNFDAATSLKTSTLDVPFIFSEADVTAWKSGDVGIIFDGNFAEVVFKGTLSQDQMAAIAAIGEPAADIPLYIKIKLPSSVTALTDVSKIKTYGTKSDAVGSDFTPPNEEGRKALLIVETEKYLLLKPGRYVADNINGYWELKDNLQDFAVSYKIGNDTYKVKINLLNPPTITKGDTATFTRADQNLAAAINDPAIKKINVTEDITLKANATLAAGKTLTIADGKMLTIAAGVTFNPGSFDVLANKGKITNHGTIVGFDITGTGLNVAARHDAGVLADGQPTQVNDDKFTVGEPIFTAKVGAANAKIEFTITVTDILTADDSDEETPTSGEWIGTRIKLPSIKDITTVQFSNAESSGYEYLAKDTTIAEADQKDSFMHYVNAKETNGVITRYLKDYNNNIVELIVTVEYANEISNIELKTRHDADVLADGQPSQVNDDKYLLSEPTYEKGRIINYVLFVEGLLTESYPGENPANGSLAAWLGIRVKLVGLTPENRANAKRNDSNLPAIDDAINATDKAISYMSYHGINPTLELPKTWTFTITDPVNKDAATNKYTVNIRLVFDKTNMTASVNDIAEKAGVADANTNTKSLDTFNVLNHETFTGADADAIRAAAHTYLNSLNLSTVQIVAFPELSEELAAKKVVMKVIGTGLDNFQLFGADSGGEVFNIVDSFWGPTAGVDLGSRPAFANLPKLRFFAGGKAGIYTFKLAFVEVNEGGVTDTVLAQTDTIKIIIDNDTTYTAPVVE